MVNVDVGYLETKIQVKTVCLQFIREEAEQLQDKCESESKLSNIYALKLLVKELKLEEGEYPSYVQP